MTTETKEKRGAAKGRIGAFAKAAPALMEGFGKVSKAATTKGRFSPAQKELVATAIAVAQGCDDCILYHVDGARRHGAEEADLDEALEVAVEMGGGPALMYAGKALEALRRLWQSASATSMLPGGIRCPVRHLGRFASAQADGRA